MAVMGRVETEHWTGQANCLGMNPDLFFPERGETHDDVLAVCAGCSVREECLDYALRHSIQEGIWGGMGPRARRRVRHSRLAS